VVLVDTTSAAERLGVTPKHVRRLAAAGRLLGAYRRGRDWWVPDVAIDRFIAQRDGGTLERTTVA
jgi:excisionase family DNA binding protein